MEKNHSFPFGKHFKTLSRDGKIPRVAITPLDKDSSYAKKIITTIQEIGIKQGKYKVIFVGEKSLVSFGISIDPTSDILFWNFQDLFTIEIIDSENSLSTKQKMRTPKIFLIKNKGESYYYHQQKKRSSQKKILLLKKKDILNFLKKVLVFSMITNNIIYTKNKTTSFEVVFNTLVFIGGINNFW